MSRETNRSSSGPQGHGGSPYPPDAGPYGTGASGGSDETADAQRPEERAKDAKTETTLTTRIKINIPGSRPIPPVVMRTPVNEEGSGGAKDGKDGPGGAAGASEQHGAADDSAHPLRAPGDGALGAAGPGRSSGGASSRTEEGTSGGGTGGYTTETSDWFAPRKPKSPSGGAGSSGPAAGGGTGAGGTGAGTGGTGQATSPYGVDPYGVSTPNSLHRTDTPPRGIPKPPGFPDMEGPDGETTGPATGDMLLPPRPGSGGGVGGGAGIGGTGGPAPEPAASSTLGLGVGPAPFAPGGVGEGMLDDGPAPGETSEDGASGASGSSVDGLPAYGGSEGRSGTAAALQEEPEGERVVGETLMSRAPRLAEEDSVVSGSPFERATVRPPARDRDKPSGGGRSKLMIAGMGVLGVVGIAYGAGLLLDHADVPNGTTVLGVDIGGLDRHEAVNKLDSAFGDRTTQPFTVVAGGKKAPLKPSVAGMTLNTEATVRDAAQKDYNPVTVIGSLFGTPRDAEPALRVDEEKMASALEQVAKKTGVGGTPKDGTVRFVGGKAVGVPGKPYKGIDAQEAGRLLQEAYRQRAETGSDSPVELPVSQQQPRVGKQEIARAIREFGKPAMSGLVTVKAGSASIQFSPEKSIPKFLEMKPVNGTLVDTYDLPALQRLYGTTFAGVKITRGDGSKTPVTPQDVAGVLRGALKQTDPRKRIVEIPLDPR